MSVRLHYRNLQKLGSFGSQIASYMRNNLVICFHLALSDDEDNEFVSCLLFCHVLHILQHFVQILKSKTRGSGEFKQESYELQQYCKFCNPSQDLKQYPQLKLCKIIKRLFLLTGKYSCTGQKTFPDANIWNSSHIFSTYSYKCTRSTNFCIWKGFMSCC